MLALLANYKVLIGGLLIALIIVIFIYIKVIKSERDLAVAKYGVLQEQLIEQNTAVAQLKAKAQAAQKTLLQAETKATLQSKLDQIEIKSILSSKVPHDCNGAIKWGAIQSAKIAKAW